MTPSTGVLVEAVVVGGALRLTFYLLIQRYLRKTLLADLQQVVREDAGLSTGDGSSLPVTPSRTKMRDYFLGSSTSLPLESPGPSAGPSGLSASRGAVSPGGGSGSETAQLSSRLASVVFCLTFSESCMLCTLVLFGGAISDRPRWLNWNTALGLSQLMIVFIIPLGICQLLTYRHRSMSSSPRSWKSSLLTAAPFCVWLFVFYHLGQSLSTWLGVTTGTNAVGFGLYNTTLERICVPGVLLIAALSGAGAVNSAWEAWTWRKVSQREPVSDATILSAERALSRARADLSLRRAEADVASIAPEQSTSSMIGRIFKSDPASARRTALKQEIAGLTAMESQMQRDLHVLRMRKSAQDQSRTLPGKIWQLISVAFALYCVYRVVMSVVNLGIGATRSGSASAEVTSKLLDLLAGLLGVQIDTETWSRLIGLALIGSILIANMRYVLSFVSRARRPTSIRVDAAQIFKATSAGVGPSFMLLCLAQLMAVWLLTSLVSLPTSNPLLESLPDFGVYARVFDAAFLIAAIGCFAVRWLEQRIRVDEMDQHASFV